METLKKIQQELKAPKNQLNKFGNYKYRSCEDILEAIKPLLGTATLKLEDEIVFIGDRYYVKATATIKDGNEVETATAYAREAQDKKGMDESQITGAASSYARKYALNGLFLIDDTKDADTQDNTPKLKPVKDFEAGLDKDLVTQIKDELKRLEPTMDKLLYKEIIEEKTKLKVIPANYNAILNKLKQL